MNSEKMKRLERRWLQDREEQMLFDIRHLKVSGSHFETCHCETNSSRIGVQVAIVIR